jgi:2-desacetyl-2-hydroxyethyl bacteriochlorophyllide A dehydrogenase
MRAAVLAEPRRIEIVNVPDAEPAAGQVLIQVEGASICGSDLTGFWGVNARMRLPTIPGHEVAGTVVGTGDGVDASLVGSRVVVEPNVSCRTCEWCLLGLPNVCVRYRVLGESMDLPGGLAERIAVAADQVYQLPPDISSAEGAVVQPLSISYHGVVDRAQVQADETVLIVGAGPIGLAALLFAREIGARCFVSDVVDDRLEIARRLGADLTIRADATDVAAVVREATDGRGADVAIEAVGGAQDQSLADASASTRIRGRIVVLGTFGKAPQPLPGYLFKNREQTMLGSHGHPGTFAPTLELVRAGRIRPADLITHTLPLDEVATAFEMLDQRSDGVVKVVLEP